MIHMPEKKEEIEALPKYFLVNIAYKTIGKPFEIWVRSRVNDRNEYVADKSDLNLKMDPEIYECYKNSTAISCKFLIWFTYSL